jgi:hypothetical protein
MLEKVKFQKLTKKINLGEIPVEIDGWEEFYNQLI